MTGPTDDKPLDEIPPNAMGKTPVLLYWIFGGFMAFFASIVIGIVVIGFHARKNLGPEAQKKAAQISSTASLPAPILPVVPPFVMTAQDGLAYSSTNLRGKVWVAGFVFTRCQGPCPLITLRMSEIGQEFSAARDFQLVTLTVDPDYDTAKVLGKYAATYKADIKQWVFLTGAKDKLRWLIGEGFRMVAADNQHGAPGDSPIIHSTMIVLVDRKGQIRGYYDSSEPKDVKDRLYADILELLKNTEP